MLKNKHMHKLLQLSISTLLILKIEQLIACTGIQGVPVLYSSVIQEAREGISPLKNQLRKLIIQLKEHPLLHCHFIAQLFTTSIIFERSNNLFSLL